MLNPRNTANVIALTVDIDKFSDLESNAVEDKLNYTFKIKANYRKSSGTYPSEMKQVNMMINFYDCTGKAILAPEQVKNISLLVGATDTT